MNSVISVDINEVIPLETDLSTTIEELLALVCEQPFLIHITLEQALPRIRRYTEDNFGCNIEIYTLCTIEGHTSVEVKIKHSAVKEDAKHCFINIKGRWTCFLDERYYKNISCIVTTALLCLQSLQDQT